MKHALLLVLMILFSFASVAQTAPLRLIVPASEDLDDYTVQQNELAVESGKNIQIGVKRSDNSIDLVSVNSREELPFTSKISTSSVSVGPGKVFIGDLYLVNTSSVSCVFSGVTGVGGNDGTTITTSQVAYLYLVVNESNPSDPKFGCLISHLSTGPTTSPYNLKWRKLYSFYSGGNFFTKDSVVSYQSGMSSTFSTTSPSACTALTFSKIPSTVQRARIQLTCATGGSTNFSIYTDSACTVGYSQGVCATGAATTSWYEFGPSQLLYYKGVVGATQTFNVIESDENRTSSN